MTLPGAEPYDETLTRTLHTALAAKGETYAPRTHHLLESGAPKYINRLIQETSPYLLQHAHNPVNWYPWGAQAFEAARKLDRPVLLSVGYSTCHWCHVMEKESFEDDEIAAFINQHFVAIKVDREERPDVDSVYMTAVNMLTGRGGWPMTVVMTPDKTPFFGGTYFPPRDGARGARTGFLTILQRLAKSYKEDRPRLLDSAARLSQAMRARAKPSGGGNMPGPESLHAAAAALSQRYDSSWGGFGRAPKFPRPCTYEFLLRYHRRTQNQESLEIVKHSLDRMMYGGIYDHLAGGFHRYSTDQRWLVPHFEKMLYDNAQLAVILIETYQATGEARYETTARDILEYIEREMTSPEGGFYSATDADSEGHEGTFFVWTETEIDRVLGLELGPIARAYYATSNRGNFEGKNILHRPASDAAVAARLRITPSELEAKISVARKKLYDARKGRIHPILDDKIITEWNAQMISAFARAGFVFGEDRYINRATAAARFVLDKLYRDGRLLRAYRERQAKHDAVLEDYAFFISALLDIFEATSEAQWLHDAIRLQATLDAEFRDPDGGYFGTSSKAEALLMREKPSYDGAQPAGNSVALLNLLRLQEFTQDQEYRSTAEKLLVAFASELEQGALGAPKLAQGLDFLLDEAKEVIIVRKSEGSADELLRTLRKTFLPNRIVLSVREDQIKDLQASIPLLEGKRVLKGESTAFVCMQGVCKKPTADPAVFAEQLREVETLVKAGEPSDM